MKNIRERDPDIVHLPNDYALTTFQTLCGLCDHPRVEETDEPVDCRSCLGVMRHVLDLAAARGVIARRPTARALTKARTS